MGTMTDRRKYLWGAGLTLAAVLLAAGDYVTPGHWNLGTVVPGTESYVTAIQDLRRAVWALQDGGGGGGGPSSPWPATCPPYYSLHNDDAGYSCVPYYTLPVVGTATLGGVKGTGFGTVCTTGYHLMGFDPTTGAMQCAVDTAGSPPWPALCPTGYVLTNNDAGYSCVASGGTPTRRPPCDSHDLGCWTLNETTGIFTNSGTAGHCFNESDAGDCDLKESSDAGRHSMLGVFGNAFYTSGSTTLTTGTTAGLHSLSAMTISFWFKPSGFSGISEVANGPDRNWFDVEEYTNGSSVYAFREAIGNSDWCYSVPAPGSYTSSLTSGVWHHFGATISANEEIDYFDGDPLCTFAYAGGNAMPPLATDGGVWSFGASSGAPIQSPGTYDDVRIADTVRSAAWFRAMYRAGTGLGEE